MTAKQVKLPTKIIFNLLIIEKRNILKTFFFCFLNLQNAHLMRFQSLKYVQQIFKFKYDFINICYIIIFYNFENKNFFFFPEIL